MAVFHPAEPSEQAEPSELEVRRHLARLGDDWHVFHGYEWQDDRGNDRETDFVLLHPSMGLIVLEVKGGRIRLEEGEYQQWHGKAGWKSTPAVKQARNGKHSIGRRVNDLLDTSTRYRMAIVFPGEDSGSALQCPGVDEGAVWGASELLTIEESIEAIVSVDGRGPSHLSASHVAQVVAYLAPSSTGASGSKDPPTSSDRERALERENGVLQEELTTVLAQLGDLKARDHDRDRDEAERTRLERVVETLKQEITTTAAELERNAQVQEELVAALAQLGALQERERGRDSDEAKRARLEQVVETLQQEMTATAVELERIRASPAPKTDTPRWGRGVVVAAVVLVLLSVTAVLNGVSVLDATIGRADGRPSSVKTDSGRSTVSVSPRFTSTTSSTVAEPAGTVPTESSTTVFVSVPPVTTTGSAGTTTSPPQVSSAEPASVDVDPSEVWRHYGPCLDMPSTFHVVVIVAANTVIERVDVWAQRTGPTVHTREGDSVALTDSGDNRTFEGQVGPFETGYATADVELIIQVVWQSDYGQWRTTDPLRINECPGGP